MSDEPLAPEAARKSTPLRSGTVTGILGFLGGVALTAAALELAGPHFPPAPPPSPGALPGSANVLPPAPMVRTLPPATDVATLDAREAALAARLDKMEHQLQQLVASARNASVYATQAERLMVAAAIRRAIERGQPLGTLESQLRARFGERHAEAVSAIIAAAAEPVTLEDLKVALDTIAPRLTSGPNDSIWARFRGFLGDLLVLRPVDMPSPRPVDRLRRARRALAEGNVEAAMAEIVHMPGITNAQGWTGAAARYVNARKALDEIEKAAAEAPPAPAPQPAKEKK